MNERRSNIIAAVVAILLLVLGYFLAAWLARADRLLDLEP